MNVKNTQRVRHRSNVGPTKHNLHFTSLFLADFNTKLNVSTTDDF